MLKDHSKLALFKVKGLLFEHVYYFVTSFGCARFLNAIADEQFNVVHKKSYLKTFMKRPRRL